MATFIIVLLAVLGILVMLGAALTFSWLGGMAAGRAIEWAMGADRPKSAPMDAQVAYYLSPEFEKEMDDLRREAQRLARVPHAGMQRLAAHERRLAARDRTA